MCAVSCVESVSGAAWTLCMRPLLRMQHHSASLQCRDLLLCVLMTEGSIPLWKPSQWCACCELVSACGCCLLQHYVPPHPVHDHLAEWVASSAIACRSAFCLRSILGPIFDWGSPCRVKRPLWPFVRSLQSLIVSLWLQYSNHPLCLLLGQQQLQTTHPIISRFFH